MRRIRCILLIPVMLACGDSTGTTTPITDVSEVSTLRKEPFTRSALRADLSQFQQRISNSLPTRRHQ